MDVPLSVWEKDPEGSARGGKPCRVETAKRRLSPGMRERSCFKLGNIQREIRVPGIRDETSWRFISCGHSRGVRQQSVSGQVEG